MSDVVAKAGQAYMKQLGAHPLRTKAITSGVLAGCSDVVAQKISGVKKLQFRRVLLIMVYYLLLALLLSRFSCCNFPIHTNTLRTFLDPIPTYLPPQSRHVLRAYLPLLLERLPFI
jgi:hypothetical protein